MLCRTCGKGMDEGQRFCRYCGTQSFGATNEQTGGPGAAHEPKRTRRRTSLIIGIAVVVLMAAVGAPIAILTARSEEGTESAEALVFTSSSPTGIDATVTAPPSGDDRETGAASGASSADTGSETGAPGATTITDDSCDYVQALTDLERSIGSLTSRADDLARQVTAAQPSLPASVYDAFSLIMSDVEEARMRSISYDVPEAYVEAEGCLQNAAVMLEARCLLMMQGIDELWASGSLSAAQPFFAQAEDHAALCRQAYDDYLNRLPDT